MRIILPKVTLISQPTLSKPCHYPTHKQNFGILMGRIQPSSHQSLVLHVIARTELATAKPGWKAFTPFFA